MDLVEVMILRLRRYYYVFKMPRHIFMFDTKISLALWLLQLQYQTAEHHWQKITGYGFLFLFSLLYGSTPISEQQI